MKTATGVLIVCRATGKIFLMKRSQGAHTNTWAMPSGMIEDGERPIDALKREITEETRINPEIIDYYYEHTEKSDGMIFYYYIGFTDKEFTPTLNDEHSAWNWFEKNELPEPLYPGMDKKIAKL